MPERVRTARMPGAARCGAMAVLAAGVLLTAGPRVGSAAGASPTAPIPRTEPTGPAAATPLTAPIPRTEPTAAANPPETAAAQNPPETVTFAEDIAPCWQRIAAPATSPAARPRSAC